MTEYFQYFARTYIPELQKPKVYQMNMYNYIYLREHSSSRYEILSRHARVTL